MGTAFRHRAPECSRLACLPRRAGSPKGAGGDTATGRGTNMFPEPDHGARIVAEALGTHALAGVFCGEIGPVGGKALLHGFTATLARLPRALNAQALRSATTPKGIPSSSPASQTPTRIASDPPALILFRPRWGRDWLPSQHQLPDCRCPRITAPRGTPSAEECTGETG